MYDAALAAVGQRAASITATQERWEAMRLRTALRGTVQGA